MSPTQRAFTLIELMITVAVLAIIATIAVPSYDYFIRRAHLRDAQAALIENAYALERIYTQKHNFGDPGTRTPDKLATNHFDIAFATDKACDGTANDRNHYCLIATAKNPAKEPRVLILTESGQMQLCDSNDKTAACKNY